MREHKNILDKKEKPGIQPDFRRFSQNLVLSYQLAW